MSFQVAGRTELECKIEQVRAERDFQAPPHLMIRDIYGRTHGGVDALDRSSKSDTDDEVSASRSRGG